MAENVRNVPKRKDTKNQFKGVHFVKGRGRWVARIQFNGKRTSSRFFNTEQEAARKYDEMALELFGEFARLNFPKEGIDTIK